MWEAYIQSHVNGTFPYTSILLPSGFRSLDGRALALREIGNLGLPILVTQQSERSLSCLSQTVAAPIRLWAFEKKQRGVMKMARRETAVLIRLSEREKKTLKRKAANYGMTVSDYARTLLINSDDATIKVIDTEPLKKAAHELAKQGTNLNQFMKFLNTYGVKVFDPEEAKRVLEKEVSSFSKIMEALAALRREADRNNVHLQIEDFDNLDNE